MIKRPRRIPFLLQAIFFGLSFFLGVTLLSHMSVLYKSVLLENEFVFFGSPNKVMQKSWLPGKFLPGVDERFRMHFTMNGGEDSFYLYVPSDYIGDLAEWFPVILNENGSVSFAHVEVHCVRIAEHEWVVTAMESSYGELLDSDLWSYHLRSAILTGFWGVGLLGFALFFFFSMLRRLVFGRKVQTSLQ